MIVAGGAISGQTDLLNNEFSYIGGSDAISLVGITANNLAGKAIGHRHSKIEINYWVKDDGGSFKPSEDVTKSRDTQYVDETEEFTLAGSTIESLGLVNLSFSGDLGNGTISPHISSPVHALPQPGLPSAPLPSGAATPSIAAGPASASISATAAISATALTPAIDLSSLRIESVQNDFRLPTGPGLFQVNTNPDHPYLVETNPLLTDSRTFLSSSYLLDRLGWDAASEMRRIGDGFYEQNLIEQSLQSATGSRYIDGVGGTDLMQQLMDNAAVAYEDLELSPGVALTADQVNRLTRSMVWMETREIDGETVLVPVVYLAADRELAYKNGALIAGGDIALTGDSDVVNAGVLRAPKFPHY